MIKNVGAALCGRPIGKPAEGLPYILSMPATVTHKFYEQPPSKALEFRLSEVYRAAVFARMDSRVSMKASILFLVSTSEYEVISMISLSRMREGISL